MARALYIIAVLFALTALYALIVDFTSTGRPSMLLGQLWFEFNATSLQVTEAVISRYLDPCALIVQLGCTPFLWHPFFSTLLSWPATIVLIGGAILFWALGRLFSTIRGGGSGKIYKGRRTSDSDLKRKGEI